ncbi:hypothetical protein HII31_05249 [Pseudocercospora fuligena]|uniref:Uncharacterized protein n=1 Tax=Pseudocercospora fuligena TaxID=685502 RepID=A0A8H6RKY8_9PEZI|nr:hypothetical protein HII31_05249 [Pseudocercospora fuligena]
MSDGIHPSGPSHPGPNAAYETAGNPTQKEPVEASRAQLNAQTDDDNAVAHRGANEGEVGFDRAVPTSLGRGIHGAPPGEETKGYTQASYDSQELDAEQMGAPGEGKVDSAVKNKPGASGSQPGLESDLDRKKAEQASARQSIKEQKQEEVDVGGILGQRGGPANPVDKNNYPNSGD